MLTKNLNSTKEATEAALSFLAKRNVLSDYLHQNQYVFALREFRKKKGDEALQALAGFYLWVINHYRDNETEQTQALVSTFSHDLRGRNNEHMLPRSDNYLKFWTERDF